jgi:hypothetical protein
MVRVPRLLPQARQKVVVVHTTPPPPGGAGGASLLAGVTAGGQEQVKQPDLKSLSDLRSRCGNVMEGVHEQGPFQQLANGEVYLTKERVVTVAGSNACIASFP